MTGKELMDCAIKECRHLPPWLAQAIDDAIAVGMGKEREACAKVASNSLSLDCEEIAGAIRSRKVT